jgi:hypothetical protein
MLAAIVAALVVFVWPEPVLLPELLDRADPEPEPEFEDPEPDDREPDEPDPPDVVRVGVVCVGRVVVGVVVVVVGVVDEDVVVVVVWVVDVDGWNVTNSVDSWVVSRLVAAAVPEVAVCASALVRLSSAEVRFSSA